MAHSTNNANRALPGLVYGPIALRGIDAPRRRWFQTALYLWRGFDCAQQQNPDAKSRVSCAYVEDFAARVVNSVDGTGSNGDFT